MSVGVLIVDDSEDIRLLLRVIIRGADHGRYVTTEAASGEEGLARLDEVDPEVIVLDEMMPGLSGLETAARIRQRRPQQKIILCSAYLNDAMRARAAAMGFEDCVPKHEVQRIPDVLRRAVGTDGDGAPHP